MAADGGRSSHRGQRRHHIVKLLGKMLCITKAARALRSGNESSTMVDAVRDARPQFGVGLPDRRRPGRRDYQDRHLIAVLRGQPPVINSGTQSVDDLAPARALIVGVSMGAACAAIMFAVWQFM